MAVEIRVPMLGESIVEATVGKWLKHEGDTVAAGEALVELETDKVNIEVMAEQAGGRAQSVKGDGENVGIGDVLGTSDADAGAEAAARQNGGAAAAPAAPAARPAGEDATPKPPAERPDGGESAAAPPAEEQ